MQINDFPFEVLSTILGLALEANESDGVSFTYGLSQAPLPVVKAKLARYVRGPISPESARWDSTRSIREVCTIWHEWALRYLMHSVFVRRWRGSERWAELSLIRDNYSIYELLEAPSGLPVYRDPFGSLRLTNKLLMDFPSAAKHVQRLWFHGFHTAETDHLIFSILRSCEHLATASIPWTLLRRGSAKEWTRLLNAHTGVGEPLQSLELQAVCLPASQELNPANTVQAHPLKDSRVDFSILKRLKIFGNTLSMPVEDRDLELIARTATNLEIIDLTNISTVSVAGMLALVKSSQKTLQVLEHSPRSDDGFYHPHPGSFPDGEHICQLLTECPKLRDLSISVPSMCADIFSNLHVKWEGECQVRAANLCAGPSCDTQKLRAILAKARELIETRNRYHHALSIEIFFAGCIFEPQYALVHGDFSLAQISCSGVWPRDRHLSTKGPYGTTGTYGSKEAGGNWDAVLEEDFLTALHRGWIQLE